MPRDASANYNVGGPNTSAPIRSAFRPIGGAHASASQPMTTVGPLATAAPPTFDSQAYTSNKMAMPAASTRILEAATASEDSKFDAPPEEVQGEVNAIFNNLSQLNLALKVKEMRDKMRKGE